MQVEKPSHRLRGFGRPYPKIGNPQGRAGILAIFPHLNLTKYNTLLDGCTKKEKNKVAAFWDTVPNKCLSTR
jgi:hypothetical protein